MKSKPYKFQGKLFRYDFDHAMVEYICKAGAEEIADEKEWMETHNKPLYGIDADGYMELDAVGLRAENWKRKAVRDEYLSQYCFDLDEEAAWLAHDFEKYELPHMKGV